MKIVLYLAWLNDGTHGNFIGDAGMADGWAKYLRRRGDVTRVDIIGAGKHPLPDDADVVIHFQHWLPLHPTAKNIFYAQNAWEKGSVPPGFGYPVDGTAHVANLMRPRFDALIFTSQGLKDDSECAGAVIPFATDPEVMFYQPDERFAHPVCFVGSDIRGPAANERYLIPAIPHGLVIYGGPYTDARLQAVHRGRLSAEDLPKVYSSARVNLNVTMPEHIRNGLVNQRIYEVLACEGTVLSDWHEGMEMMKNWVLGTAGAEQMAAALADDIVLGGGGSDGCRDFILQNHTYAHRMALLMKFLGEIG